jgi:hypothetical protein
MVPLDLAVFALGGVFWLVQPLDDYFSKLFSLHNVCRWYAHFGIMCVLIHRDFTEILCQKFKFEKPIPASKFEFRGIAPPWKAYHWAKLRRLVYQMYRVLDHLHGLGGAWVWRKKAELGSFRSESTHCKKSLPAMQTTRVDARNLNDPFKFDSQQRHPDEETRLLNRPWWT